MRGLISFGIVVYVVLCSFVTDASVVDFHIDRQDQEQHGSPGEAVDGSFSWVSPEDYVFLVKYVADEKGYRVVESNAVPLNADGVAADGSQAAIPTTLKTPVT